MLLIVSDPFYLRVIDIYRYRLVSKTMLKAWWINESTYRLLLDSVENVRRACSPLVLAILALTSAWVGCKDLGGLLEVNGGKSCPLTQWPTALVAC